MSWKMLFDELIDKNDEEIGPYLMLPYIFPVLASQLGFGGHIGLFWVAL